MPKMKSHRGAAKRFKKTGSGKIKRAKAYAYLSVITMITSVVAVNKAKSSEDIAA